MVGAFYYVLYFDKLTSRGLFMPELNKDGLEPGSNIDFAAIQKANHERKIKAKEAPKKPVKSKKAAKAE